MPITFRPQTVDVMWGCSYQEVLNSTGPVNVKMGLIEVDDLQKFATQITIHVLNNSWMAALTPMMGLAYNVTVGQTANKLAGISGATSLSGALNAAFGELMVSVGSAHALEKIFTHQKVPLAELWKPQVSQNEGFDFHTTCATNRVNFGEAKYSSVTNSYKSALVQAERFLDEEKHFSDIPHLVNLVSQQCMTNFGK